MQWKADVKHEGAQKPDEHKVKIVLSSIGGPPLIALASIAVR